MSEKIKILIAEDEDQMTHSMSFLLQVGGYNVQTVSNGREAIESITNGIKNNNPFDLLITDIQMPEMTGEELIESLRFKNIEIAIMVITGFGDRDMLVRLLRKGSIEYLDKPFSGNYFISVVNSLAEQIKVKKDNTNNLANLEVERREKIGNELKRLRLHYDEMYKQLANAGSIYNRIVRIDKNKLKLPATFHNRPLWNCGGDYAAIRNTSDGIIATVADVTGHDMAASFYTMIINTIFEEHFDKGLTGDLFLDLLNNAILDSSGDNRQVATTVININLAKKLADISIASHTPVMYVSPQNNVIRPIYIRGSLLGIKDNIKNETVRIPINENDRFYLFTDGITGAYRTDYNGNRVFLNDSGIEEFIKNTLDIPFTESSEIIWKNIKEFCRGKFTDDALLLGLEIKFPLIEN